jgi:hypothetical protein
MSWKDRMTWFDARNGALTGPRTITIQGISVIFDHDWMCTTTNTGRIQSVHWLWRLLIEVCQTDWHDVQRPANDANGREQNQQNAANKTQ